MAKGDALKDLDKRHKLAEKTQAARQKCQDCRNGQTAIHAAGELYLPKLSGQTQKEYNAYRKRAVFYGAFSRTIDAFTGMVMRVPPSVSGTDPMLEDVDAGGESLFEFADLVLEAAQVQGFGGVLVEHTPRPAEAVTVAEAEARGLRPYLAWFDADRVLNWRARKGAYTYVVLQETEELDDGTERELYRVLDFDEAQHYRQRAFELTDAKRGIFTQVSDDIYPELNGARMSEIPFYTIGDAGELPPLIDLADLNISHYMTTADLENGCHFTGIPTPWIAGHTPGEKEVLRVGGTDAWVFPDPKTNVSYLEFSGQGLEALERRIETKEKQMSALGARMLSDSIVQETATAAGLKSAGEFSALAQTAGNVSKVLTRAVSFMLEWAGRAPVAVVLNTKYLPAKLSPQELTALVQALQTGSISAQTFFYNLQQGEVIPADKLFEDEQAQIGEQGQNLANTGAGGAM